MPVERCPWCGAKASLVLQSGTKSFVCDSVYFVDLDSHQSAKCCRRQRTQLRARVTRLESTLRTIADTHGPDTIAGDAAREALRADP